MSWWWRRRSGSTVAAVAVAIEVSAPVEVAVLAGVGVLVPLVAVAVVVVAAAVVVVVAVVVIVVIADMAAVLPEFTNPHLRIPTTYWLGVPCEGCQHGHNRYLGIRHPGPGLMVLAATVAALISARCRFWLLLKCSLSLFSQYGDPPDLMDDMKKPRLTSACSSVALPPALVAAL